MNIYIQHKSSGMLQYLCMCVPMNMEILVSHTVTVVCLLLSPYKLKLAHAGLHGIPVMWLYKHEKLFVNNVKYNTYNYKLNDRCGTWKQ